MPYQPNPAYYIFTNKVLSNTAMCLYVVSAAFADGWQSWELRHSPQGL